MSAAAELDAIPVPDTGRLLFTLTGDHEVDPDGTAAMVANLEEVAQQLAPGRWQIVVLAHGLGAGRHGRRGAGAGRAAAHGAAAVRRMKPLRRSGHGIQPRPRTPRPRKPLPVHGRTPAESLAYDDLLTLLYGRCERCGASVLGGFDPHHRKLRSQGGPDTASNLVAICRACHDWAHAHPIEARASGWMVRRGSDPAAVALVLHDARTVRLDDDGGYDVCWDAA